uniref:Uncharacterized protein n=1 Tax=Larimichthys crocea TaxID=215358 RepID=A0A0F8CER3_LARCR
MKGLILLSLMGLILAVSIGAPWNGTWTPIENYAGFGPPPEDEENTQWNGTWTPVENYAGFGPPPEDEENTQYTGHILPFEGEGRFSTVAPVTQQHTGYILPFEGEGAIPTAASVENAQQSGEIQRHAAARETTSQVLFR